MHTCTQTYIHTYIHTLRRTQCKQVHDNVAEMLLHASLIEEDVSKMCAAQALIILLQECDRHHDPGILSECRVYKTLEKKFMHAYTSQLFFCDIFSILVTSTWTFMYVCVYVYIYIYIYIYIHTYIHTMYMYTHTCIHTYSFFFAALCAFWWCRHEHLYTHTYTHTHTYSCFLRHIVRFGDLNMSIHTYMHTSCIHTHTHTHAHTRIHTAVFCDTLCVLVVSTW
jgi:hypothetical protein